jgi:hypothetical protein
MIEAPQLQQPSLGTWLERIALKVAYLEMVKEPEMLT